jgi:decaprenylphospho-beta-D-erythro-pentofuranosid-2-ulose 2-reductase
MTILILGSTSDIGMSIAQIFAAKGFSIQLAGRNLKNQEIVANDLRIRYNTEVETYFFDAINYNSHLNFYQKLASKPDIAVCVFGYLGEQSTAQQNWEETEKIIDINYKGAVSILNIIADDFEKRKSGTIIGISSVAGDRGRMSNYIYGSAKAAFSAYLSGLRNRLFHSNVHVVTVKPGFVATKMTAHLPLPKLLTAEPRNIAITVYKAFKSKKNNVYSLSIWRYIMLIIIHLPEFIFKRLKL